MLSEPLQTTVGVAASVFFMTASIPNMLTVELATAPASNLQAARPDQTTSTAASMAHPNKHIYTTNLKLEEPCGPFCEEHQYGGVPVSSIASSGLHGNATVS